VKLSELETRLAAALRTREEVRFALLFGSAVRRGPDAAGDVDLAIGFRGSPSWFERARLANEIEASLGRPVDLVDLDEASTLLRWEVAQTGHVVADADREALIAFLVRMPTEYESLRPFLSREADGLRDHLRGAR
jgi:predicted nucleotidyltransferase